MFNDYVEATAENISLLVEVQRLSAAIIGKQFRRATHETRKLLLDKIKVLAKADTVSACISDLALQAYRELIISELIPKQKHDN